jgi:hypothetical protein
MCGQLAPNDADCQGREKERGKKSAFTEQNHRRSGEGKPVFG